jgi:hypothetical protein
MAFANGPKIVTDGLVLALDAADRTSYPGSGTAWNDLAGSNNGTLTNGPTFNSGNGGSIVFDGTNDYVRLINNNLNIGELTICAWVNFSDTNNETYSTITNKETSNINRNWWLGLSPNGKFTFIRSVSGVDTPLISDITPSLNQWYFISATNDTQPIFKIYINGGLNRVSSLSGTLSTSGTFAWIGTYSENIGLYPMDGKISNIQIYNKALTASEVLQNYDATKKRFGL